MGGMYVRGKDDSSTSMVRWAKNLITHGVSGRRRKSRSTCIESGLGNHLKVEMT
jgi:hypothetical protein